MRRLRAALTGDDGAVPAARPVLAVLLVALLFSLAGCADYQSVEEEARVVVVNEDDAAHKVLVEVVRDGTPVVREGRAVRAGNSWSLSMPLEPVAYELQVTTSDGGETTRPFEVPVAGDESAYVEVTVAPNGSLSSRVLVPE